MAKLSIAAVVVIALLGATAASAAEPGTIEGRILDSTCFGPCSLDMDPVAYTGEATIVVKRLPQRHRIARLDPEAGGLFNLRLPRGRYLISVRIEDPCFVEDERKLRVSAGGDIDRPELIVHNGCIL